MSTLQEKKFLQLIKFSFDLSLKVTRTFTKTNVLNTYNNSFVDFLNAKKHEIYHLWTNNTRCCVCTSNALLKKNRDLHKEQFTKLFDINGNTTPSHFRQGQGNYIVQYCLCGISCIASCSLDDLDVIVIHTLLRKFVKLNPDDEMWLDTIRNIRNKLAHAVSTTCFDQGRLEKWWFKLERSVLGLAGKIPPDNYADIIEDHIKLLGKFDFNIKDEEIRNLIETENKKLYDQIIKEHDNKFQQIMDKQDVHAKNNIDKSETIKEEIIKHITQTQAQDKEEILKKIEESHIVCRICRRVDAAEIPCRKDAQAIEASCQVTGENIDEKLILSNLQLKKQKSGFNITSAETKCIILELSASPDIFQSRESFRRAILSLITRIEQAGELDSSMPYSIEFNLTFNTPLTQDEVRTVSSLSTLRLNGDTAQEMQADHDDLSIEIRKLTFPVKLHGMATDMKSETTETTVYKTEDSDMCQVEWRLRIPDIWKVDQIKHTLENVSQMLRQWFHIEFIYVGGPLVIHTSVPRHVLIDKPFLKSAIQSFLEKIVEVCEIDTDVQETVNVDFRVLEMTSHTETDKSEVERLTQLPMYSEKESTTEEDTVSCKHCHKQFPCDQCSRRRKQIDFLVTDNRRKTQTIKDMEMESLKAEPESEDSNDYDFAQVEKTTEPLELGDTESSGDIIFFKRLNMPLTTTHTEEEKMLAHLGKIVLHVFPCIFKFILSEVNPLTLFVRRSIVHNYDLKGKLSHEENTVLENLQTDGYSGFTLQLCYKFFIYFEWFGPPKQKWGNEPTEFDIELADDIERIRHVSNMIHSTTVHSMSKDVYNLLLEKVRRVCERIEHLFDVPGRFSSEMDLEEKITREEILDLVDSIKEHKEISDNPFPSDRITQGRNRYARFGLVVVEMMPKLAREIISHNIHPRALLNLVNTARRNDPAKLEKIISHNERVSLNTLRSGTYELLDFTTIYKLIRSFALVDAPAQGWGKQPMMHDTDIADDIERLRVRRNRIVYNLSTSISQTTFDEFFTDFTTVAKRVDQYLGKSTGTGFETEVHNYKTCPLDYELEQKYKQALQEIENMKYRLTEGKIHFYYGNTFERFIERVKTESAKSEKRQFKIVINDNKDTVAKTRILNDLKTEINTGQVRIEFDRAETGSLVLFIDVLDKVISSDSFYSEVGNLIERILEFVYSAEKSKREMDVIMIQVDDCCDVDFVIEDETLYTCITETPVDPKSIRVEVNVNTELFQSGDLFHAELANFIKKASDTNETGGKSDVSAILTTHVSEIFDDTAAVRLQDIQDSSKVKYEITEIIQVS